MQNVADATGTIRVAVCDVVQWLKPSCSYTAQVPAQKGSVVAIVHNVPPGVYGIQVHHDSDGDNKINRNFFGIPTEGIGFSRDAPMRFGPPKFDEAAIKIGEPLNVVSVTLRFEPKGGQGR